MEDFWDCNERSWGKALSDARHGFHFEPLSYWVKVII